MCVLTIPSDRDSFILLQTDSSRKGISWVLSVCRDEKSYLHYKKDVVISTLKTMHQLSYYHVKLSYNPRVNLYHGFY